MSRRISTAKAGRLLVLLLLAASLSFLAVACQEEKAGNPLLPAGFRETQIPDVSIKGYAYLRPETPLAVPVSRFLDGQEAVPGLPSEAGIALWTVWVGPRPSDFGMAFRFSDPAALDAVTRQLNEKPGRMEHMRLGDSLYLFHEGTEWVEALKASISESRFVPVPEAYPDEWKLIEMLPEAPPGKVLGAGFGRVDEEFLQGMDAELGGLAADARQLVETARIKNAVFALYADGTPGSLAEFDEDFLTNMDLSALVITKAGYPGFIVNFMFSRAASGAGLEKIDIQGGDVYYKTLQEDLRLMLKNRGSTFFVTLASNKDSTQRLMESALQD